MFNKIEDGYPDKGRECWAWARDPLQMYGSRPYRLPFAVIWDGQSWKNAQKDNPLLVTIAGWTYKS